MFIFQLPQLIQFYICGAVALFMSHTYYWDLLFGLVCFLTTVFQHYRQRHLEMTDIYVEYHCYSSAKERS